MKTTLSQQKDLIQDIFMNDSLPSAVRKLRDWLEAHGYEGDGKCQHYAILRTTGKCMNCGSPVSEPIVLDSDDAIAVLRDRLDDK